MTAHPTDWRRQLGGTASRRQLLRAAVGIGAGVGAGRLLTACGAGGSSKSGSGQVVVRTAGGSYEEGWRKACFEPFEKDTGIKIVTASDPVEKITAAAKAGNVQIDVLQLGVRQLELLRVGEAVQKLDYSRFQRTDPKDIRLVEDYYIGTIAWASVIAYNTKSFADKTPKTWADVWNVGAFPGKRTFSDSSSGLIELEAPLLADGVPIDQLYPLDLDRAFRKMAEIKPNVAKFYGSGDEQVQLYRAGTAVLGMGWNGRIQVLKDGGSPMEIEWNQNLQSTDGLGITKGAPNLDNAYKLVDYSLQPAVLAKLAEYTGYSPLCDKSYPLIPQAVLDKLPATPERAKLGVVRNVEWWVKNQAEVDKRWLEFLVK
ncbi:ABC transporter substrate-binding protein [Dactylosporangium sp. CA-092794]|uniref:ABC transporter substrate-binding protein n=1 Tax=Dactylosporangium sp. CA-092794 TaxID=3239929 RepID=UPI003D9033E5